MSDNRKIFEAYVSSKYPKMIYPGIFENDELLYPGEYEDQIVQFLWEAWQAAVASERSDD